MGLVFRTALAAALMFACVAPAAVYAQQAISARKYDCQTGEVRVQGPADAPVAGTSENTQIDYSRRGKRGSIHIGAYDNVDRGGYQSALFPLLALPAAYAPGAQIPFLPLHKAGLLIDAIQPRAKLE
jgi:hypothetical protein